MNCISLTILIVTCLLSSLQPALAASDSRYANQEDSSGCVRGKALLNLQATFPHPMKVVEACDLRWSNGKHINLSLQKVSLDQYTDGDMPQGVVLVTGRARLSGQFRYEPGNSGDAWLTPHPSLIAPHHKALAAQLSSIKFADVTSMGRFRVPPTLRNSNCFTANMTIEIDGINLIIGETDEAGAYPIKFKVVDISGFKKCAEGEE